MKRRIKTKREQKRKSKIYCIRSKRGTPNDKRREGERESKEGENSALPRGTRGKVWREEGIGTWSGVLKGGRAREDGGKS